MIGQKIEDENQRGKNKIKQESIRKLRSLLPVPIHPCQWRLACTQKVQGHGYTIEMLLHGCVFLFSSPDVLFPIVIYTVSCTQLLDRFDRTINTEPIPYTYIYKHETKTTHVAVE